MTTAKLLREQLRDAAQVPINMAQLERNISDPANYAPPAIRNAEEPEIAHIRRKMNEALDELKEFETASTEALSALKSRREELEKIIVDDAEAQIVAHKRYRDATNVITRAFEEAKVNCRKLDEPKEEGK